MSMGKLHHAMMGTAAVAIGTAAAIPGTLVNLAAGGGARNAVRFGHPSGTLRVGAEAKLVDGQWTVTKAIMPRSARAQGRGARAGRRARDDSQALATDGRYYGATLCRNRRPARRHDVAAGCRE
jgi:hypothetical protein